MSETDRKIEIPVYERINADELRIKIPELRTLHRRLEELPLLIEACERAEYKIGDELEEFNYSQTGIELALTNDIASDSDDSGKKKYSNEDMRKHELRTRLNSNADYQNLKSSIQVKSISKSNEEILMRKYNNELKVRLAQLKIWEISKI